MNLGVTVLHNVTRLSFFGFDPETADLRHGHMFQVEADSVNEAAKLVWMLGNVDGPDDLPAHLSLYGLQVREYRDRMNRSLSVGDVLVMVDLDKPDLPTVGVMACESLGWKGLEYLPDYEAGSNLDPTSRSYEAYCQQWSQTRRN